MAAAQREAGSRCRTVSLPLELGPAAGEGASGTCSPLLNAIDGGHYVVKEVRLKREWQGISASDAACDDHLMEVRLHRLVSEGCANIVRYAFAQIVGEVLCICMEACDFPLWDTLVGQDGKRSGLAVGQSQQQPQHARSSLCCQPVEWSEALQSQRRSLEMQRLAISADVCSALRHCHGLRVLHRDVNPWNVLLVRRSEGPGPALAARLSDFGLAARLPPSTQELQGMGMDAEAGAPALDASALGSIYSAPELGQRYGFAADVFSAGMTLLALWVAADCVDKDALITATEVAKQAAADTGEEEQVEVDSQMRMPKSWPGKIWGGQLVGDPWASRPRAVLPTLARMLLGCPVDRPSAVEVHEDFAQTRADFEAANTADTTADAFELLRQMDRNSDEKIDIAELQDAIQLQRVLVPVMSARSSGSPREAQATQQRPAEEVPAARASETAVRCSFERALGAQRVVPWRCLQNVLQTVGVHKEALSELQEKLPAWGAQAGGEEGVDFDLFLDWLYSSASSGAPSRGAVV